LVRVDLASGAAKQHLLAGSPRSVLLQGDDQVVTIRGVPGAHRGGTLRVVSGPYAFPNSPDPAYGQAWTGNLTLLTNDGLLGYARVGGPDGETIVEDLAAAIPTPSDGGRTYRFQLRPGIRFSTGDPVRARDVARSIERARVAPGGAWGLASIVGAGTCSFAAPCDLSHSVVGGDASGTVTVHLTAPDPYFLYALAMPAAAIVPASTPLGEQTAPLPATGPYMYDRFGPTSGVRLVRNPAFVQWSAKAQPYGYPDVIEWSEVDRSSDPSIQVERGNADWAADELPPDRILHLATPPPRVRNPPPRHAPPRPAPRRVVHEDLLRGHDPVEGTVRRSEGPASRPSRNGSSGGPSELRRPDHRPNHLPGAATDLPGLFAVLSLDRRPRLHGHVARPGHPGGTGADRGRRRDRRQGHHLRGGWPRPPRRGGLRCVHAPGSGAGCDHVTRRSRCVLRGGWTAQPSVGHPGGGVLGPGDRYDRRRPVRRHFHLPGLPRTRVRAEVPGHAVRSVDRRHGLEGSGPGDGRQSARRERRLGGDRPARHRQQRLRTAVAPD